MHKLPQQSCKLRRIPAKRSESGQAVVETAFLVPWIFFIFVGVLDVGFYCYGLMASDNAARAAAVQLSSVYTTPPIIQPQACTIALAEMQSLPNIYNLPSTFTCNVKPLIVTASCYDYTTGAGSTTACGSCGSNIENCANRITVTYTSVLLIPIPGILANQFTFNQKAEVRFGG